MICFLVSEGSPRVEGDEDEEDIDDIEYEFNIEHEGQCISPDLVIPPPIFSL